MFRRQSALAVSGFAVLLLLVAGSARATYSIVACDAKTRECGVAVQTNNLAVGASVPYAQAGVGALVSQFETNPHYGPRAMALLVQGASPEQVVKRLLEEDGNFDGQGPEARQVGVVSIDGRAANYTGEEAQREDWAGVRSGSGYSIQGNGLAGANVLEAMERIFLNTEGPLADKLMAALTAGDTAGGQRTGRESAALLVKTTDGWPMDIDLRVDHSSDPVGELRKLFDMQSARQQVIRANQLASRGQLDQARSLFMSAVALGSMWPRVWIKAARVAEDIEEPTLALQYLTVAFQQNPAWAQAEIGDGNYAELGANAQFHRWVSRDQEQAVLATHRRMSESKGLAIDARMKDARMLLEIAHAEEALAVLTGISEREDESADLRLLRSTAYAATGNYTQAVEQCKAALRKAPNESRIQRKLEWLNQESNSNSPR